MPKYQNSIQNPYQLRPPQTPAAHLKRPYRKRPGTTHLLELGFTRRGSSDKDLAYIVQNPSSAGNGVGSP